MRMSLAVWANRTKSVCHMSKSRVSGWAKACGQRGTFSARSSSPQKSSRREPSFLVIADQRHPPLPDRSCLSACLYPSVYCREPLNIYSDSLGPTLPDLTTSWSFELMFSEVLADLLFLTGAILSVLGVGEVGGLSRGVVKRGAGGGQNNLGGEHRCWASTNLDVGLGSFGDFGILGKFPAGRPVANPCGAWPRALVWFRRHPPRSPSAGMSRASERARFPDAPSDQGDHPGSDSGH